MKRKALLITSLIVFTAAPLALAEDFLPSCQERTAEYFADIDDPAAACDCIASKASPELLEQMAAAETPAELPDEAKEIMKSCGYALE